MKVQIDEYTKDGSPRTVMVHIDDWDTWDAHSTLALIIHPLLLKFKEANKSHPCMHAEDARSDFDPCNNCVCDREWNDVLDKMIWSFAHILDNSDEDQFYTGELDHILIPVDNDGNEVPEDQATFWRTKKGPNDTFKVDYEGLTQYNNRIQEGLNLFGKWYQHLWN